MPQLTVFILLFGGLQGLLLSLFMVRRKLYQGGYSFLLLFLGVLLLQLTFKIMSKGWLMENWTALYFFSYYLPILYGPLTYLFVKNLLQNSSLKLRDLWHFFPATICFTGVVLIATHTSPEWLERLILNPEFRFTILLISLLVYHWKAYLAWQENRLALQQYYSDTRQVQLNWLRQFIFIAFFTGLVVSIALHLLYIYFPKGVEFRYGFFALTLIIYWISYSALTKPSVFSAIKGFGNEISAEMQRLPQLKVYHAIPRYANSGLDDEQVRKICSLLDKMVVQEKIYLQPDLSINDLADKLQCTRHHLSQVLNENLKKSYYDYINLYRVEEAMRLLKSPSRKQHKIASIAYDAGFNSLSTFNEVFKKVTGQTPSHYRKQSLSFSEQQRV